MDMFMVSMEVYITNETAHWYHHLLDPILHTLVCVLWITDLCIAYYECNHIHSKHVMLSTTCATHDHTGVMDMDITFIVLLCFIVSVLVVGWFKSSFRL